MMKKWAVGLLSSALILGAGTAVIAAGNDNTENRFSFENMLPFMEKMHPNSNKEELKEMYDTCHKEGGMMDGKGMMDGNGMMDGKAMNSGNMMNKF
jgi:hypothetical protein